MLHMITKAISKLATTTAPEANYSPIVLNGEATHIRFPLSMWDKIRWEAKQFEPKAKVIFMIVALYKDDKIDAHASVTYSRNSGKIMGLCYQSNVSLDESNVFDIHTFQDEKRKQQVIEKTVQSLVQYFKDANDLEYEKAIQAPVFGSHRMSKTTRVIMQGCAADGQDADSNQNVEYDPNAPKATVYVGNPTVHNRPYNYTVDCWHRRGYYRTYKKSGKRVYVPATTVYRRKV